MDQSSQDNTRVDVGPPGATPAGAVSSQSSRDKRGKRSAGESSMRGEGKAISAPEADVVAEGERLTALAADAPIRLLGGVAIRLRAPGELPSAFAREYADLDFVTAKGGTKVATRFFRDAGYEPHVSFNALHGG